MRKKAPEWQVDSAGTASWHVGKAPYGPMQVATGAAGYPMQDLRARQVSVADFDAFDLVLGMDGQNLADLEAMRPEGATARLKTLADYVDDADHVPDPYYTRDFDGALRLIERCVEALIAEEEAAPRLRGYKAPH